MFLFFSSIFVAFASGLVLYNGYEAYRAGFRPSRADCWAFGFLAFSVSVLQPLLVALNFVASSVDQYQYIL
jgi:hypothetical protein